MCEWDGEGNGEKKYVFKVHCPPCALISRIYSSYVVATDVGSFDISVRNISLPITAQITYNAHD